MTKFEICSHLFFSCYYCLFKFCWYHTPPENQKVRQENKTRLYIHPIDPWSYNPISNLLTFTNCKIPIEHQVKHMNRIIIVVANVLLVTQNLHSIKCCHETHSNYCKWKCIVTHWIKTFTMLMIENKRKPIDWCLDGYGVSYTIQALLKLITSIKLDFNITLLR